MRTDNVKVMVNITRETTVCERLTIADTARARMRGLIGEKSLAQGQGILLTPAPSIHTAFMRFPIDVVFLDRALRVVKLVGGLRPWRMASARGARAVVELPEGVIARTGLAVGDRCTLIDDAGADRSRHRGTVALLVSDRRFGAVTSMLLSRTGYHAVVRRSDEDLVAAVVALGADVVVAEPHESLTALARDAARLRQHCPGVGVVLVGDEDASPELNSVPVVPKWGPFSSLVGAIEDVRGNGARRRQLHGRH